VPLGPNRSGRIWLLSQPESRSIQIRHSVSTVDHGVQCTSVQICNLGQWTRCWLGAFLLLSWIQFCNPAIEKELQISCRHQYDRALSLHTWGCGCIGFRPIYRSTPHGLWTSLGSLSKKCQCTGFRIYESIPVRKTPNYWRLLENHLIHLRG
jgi:hypothetical protein